MNSHSKRLALANILGLAAVLTVNYLSNALPLNGKTPAQLSDQYPNLFTPAGLTFSIWGVIYAWLLVWASFQTAAFFSRSVAERVQPTLLRVGWLFAATCACNIAWLLAWHWEQVGLSVAIMLALLAALFGINQRLHPAATRFEKWTAQIPLGIYQGWITVALIANVTALLVAGGWSGGDAAPLWAMAMIAIGAAVAIGALVRQNNIGHALAVTWALVGIFLKRNNSDAAGSPWVAYAALAAALLVLTLFAVRTLQNR
jgi:translocator protein